MTSTPHIDRWWYSSWFIFWFPIFVHLDWAWCLAHSEAATKPTPVHHMMSAFLIAGDRRRLVVLLVIASVLALWSMVSTKAPMAARMLAIIPQQFILLYSATGCLMAINDGFYADKVIRDYYHLRVDLSWDPYFTLFHSFALWQVFMPEVRRWIRR